MARGKVKRGWEPQREPSHPGDDGDWCLDSASRPRQSPEDRAKQSMSVVSPEVMQAMRAEDAFLDTIHGTPDLKRFTDRRPIPGRNRLIP
jgi:hypothetical protein